MAELVAAVRAADEEDDDLEEHARQLTPAGSSYLPPRRQPERHRLERPLQMLLSFPQRPKFRRCSVDVLEYAAGGRLLWLALPPELELSEGEVGELRLMRTDAQASSEPQPLPFVVARLEPGSLVKLAVVSIEASPASGVDLGS